MNKLAMLKVYLADRIKVIESGEEKSHPKRRGPMYDRGVLNTYRWVTRLLNEPATLKTYYDKAVGK